MIEKRFVWMDKDLCTGCGDCTEIAPNVFKLNDFDLAVVHLDGVEVYDGGINGRTLGSDEVDGAVAAAEACPGEIIWVDIIK